MITNLTICSKNSELLSFYSNYLSDLKMISLKKVGESDFISRDYDIISLPTSIAHYFGARPWPLDCQIIETKKSIPRELKVEIFPDLITNVPNFNNIVDYYSELDQAFLNFSIPLMKVNDYSNDRNISLKYGILDEYSFGCYEVNDTILTKVRNEINSVFNINNEYTR